MNHAEQIANEMNADAMSINVYIANIERNIADYENKEEMIIRLEKLAEEYNEIARLIEQMDDKH